MEFRSKVNLAVSVVVLVLLLLFMIVNRQVVELNLLIARVEMPRSVMLVCVLLLGFLLGWITRAMMARRKRKAE